MTYNVYELTTELNEMKTIRKSKYGMKINKKFNSKKTKLKQILLKDAHIEYSKSAILYKYTKVGCAYGTLILFKSD